MLVSGRELALVLILASILACGVETASPPDGGRADGSPTGDAPASADASPPTDLDGDSLEDALEQQLAEAYLPYLSLHPSDGCPLGAIVFRLRPHPTNPAMVHIIYDHLFERDCGLTSHVGDNEVFSVTIDPRIPPPLGIIAMKAISHQGTACERTSECGACGALPACETTLDGGAAWPVVWSSRDKHASYVESSTCDPFTSCFDTCSLSTSRDRPPMTNAGEPDGHLTEDLTTAGLITAANGWSEVAVFNYNPWDPITDFGSAGNVYGDLTDASFDTCSN